MKNKNIQAAFLYMYCSLMRMYLDKTPDEIIEDLDKSFFKRTNDFSFKKMNLYPFFITMGSRDRSFMLELFQEKFIPLEFGIVHKEIFEKKTFENFFEMNGFLSLHIKDDMFLPLSKIQTLLSDLYSVSSNDMQMIASKIDESLSFIETKKIKNFANLSLDVLMYWSQAGLTFGVYSKSYQKVLQENEESLPVIIKMFNLDISEIHHSLSFG